MSTSNTQSALKLTEQADQARSHRELGVALVWINTASLLDTSEQKSDIASSVNARLLGVIYDAATYSEDLALKCGNFTTAHAQWLGQMREATAILVARLAGDTCGTRSSAASESLAAVALLSGHFDTLHKRFVTHSYESVNLPTPVKEIKSLVETLMGIRAQVAELAPKETCSDRTTLQRLVTLNYLVGNASSHVLCLPLRFLTDWDAALFYTAEASRYAGDLTAAADGVYGTEDEINQLRAILVNASTTLTSRNYHGSKRALAEASALITRIGGFRAV